MSALVSKDKHNHKSFPKNLRGSLIGIFVLLFFIVYSCNVERHPIILNLGETQKISNVTQASEIFPEYRFINLERKDDQYTGGTINKILKDYDILFLFDYYMTNLLFVYNENGAFIKKLNREDYLPVKMDRIQDFSINPYDDNIYLLTETKIFVLNYNLELITSFNNTYGAFAIASLKDHLVFETWPWETNRLVITDKKGNIVKEAFPSGQVGNKDINAKKNQNFVENQGQIYWLFLEEKKLFKIHGNGQLDLAYEVRFLNDEIPQFFSYQVANDHLIIVTQIKKEVNAFIYELKNSENSIRYSNIQNDIDFTGGLVVMPFSGNADGCLIKFVDAEHIEAIFTETDENAFNPLLKSNQSKIMENSNGVLVFIKPGI
ncbi:MAG TPA: 6-bladed beta-propeller [Saprospiraceae bacterium]|nr:6-bladed beta-propeller [Saprospiraceae bacterium]